MGEPSWWQRIYQYLNELLHKILCLLNKHQPPINLKGELDTWCWYCYKELGEK